MANGMSADEVCKRLGIDMPVWDEVNQLWVKRMQQDQTMAVMSLYGQYYGNANTHPKFNDSVKESNQEGDYLAKIQNDEAFYYELCGARQAAYEAGLDGAQWIQDNYGISLGDFQSAAMKWMSNMSNIQKMLQYQEQKQRADALQDSFFASADVMYEMLAYLNASRLYHGKDAIMASDINGIVENNPILNTLANDLRQTSIESGIGIVSELPESQEHLREHVMNVWRTRMAEPGERDRIHAQLFTHRNIPDGEELF